MGGKDQEVRTLFLAGLPDDVKDREIYNLFRPYHSNYESCQIKYTGRGYQRVAFVVLKDHETAMAAKEALDGHNFDPQNGSILHVDLARSNTRSKRSRSEDFPRSSLEKKFRVPLDIKSIYPEPGVGGGTMHIPGMVHSVYDDMNSFSASQSIGLMGKDSFGLHDSLQSSYSLHNSLTGNLMVGSSMLAQHSGGTNPPCSTLFIANLGPSCTEEELAKILIRFPGFQKLKIQSNNGFPVAFVEFQDTFCSSQALVELQNVLLPSSDRGGMRVEYAKAQMGLPRRDRKGRF